MKSKIQISVEEFASLSPITADISTPTQELWKMLKSADIRHLPIVENGKAVGIVSERNLNFLTLLNQKDVLKAKDVMVKNPFTVKIKDTLETVCLEMSKRKVGSAIVVNDENEVLGIFTTTDALNALIDIVRGDYT